MNFKHYSLCIILLTLSLSCGESPTEVESLYFRISGRNMQLWTTKLGEASNAGYEENEVTLADIRTDHRTDKSEILVNVKKRKIQAYNINYYMKTDSKAMNVTHKAAFNFSLKHPPSSGSSEQNGDVITAGLYICDGSTSMSEYAAAFQWVVNPWRADYGKLYTWTGSQWLQRDTIPPDSLDHIVELSLDHFNQTASIKFDRYAWRDVYSKTAIDSLESGINARLEFSAANAYTLEAGYKPSFNVYFKNWKWEWAL